MLRDLLPHLDIALPDAGFIDPHALYGGKTEKVWLEVGFGGGEHLAAQAAHHPETGFIGCEPFLNGVAGLLDHIDRQGLRNVRVYPDDARVLLDRLPDGSLDRCFVLYPDPWPKKRHRERRFICEENLNRLARTLKAGGELRLATDVADLAAWMRDKTSGHVAFQAIYDGPAPPPDWFVTRYEEKGKKAGREPVYLIYRKKAN